jgi:hypothetical protein
LQQWLQLQNGHIGGDLEKKSLQFVPHVLVG